jgi:hypothetical protein
VASHARDSTQHDHRSIASQACPLQRACRILASCPPHHSLERNVVLSAKRLFAYGLGELHSVGLQDMFIIYIDVVYVSSSKVLLPFDRYALTTMDIATIYY